VKIGITTACLNSNVNYGETLVGVRIVLSPDFYMSPMSSVVDFEISGFRRDHRIKYNFGELFLWLYLLYLLRNVRSKYYHLPTALINAKLGDSSKL
jgi:hypothetical protein